MAERILKSRALKAARAKLPLVGNKELQQNLDDVVGCCSRCSDAKALAEAYRIGAAEAQHEIARRIAALGEKEPT